MQATINKENFDVIVEYKNNKNLYIRVKEDLKIYVTCNRHFQEKDILTIINNNQKSILRMYNHQVKEKSLKEETYYLGKPYTLVIDESIKSPIIEDDLLFVSGKNMLNKFFQDACLQIFQERLVVNQKLFTNIPKYSLKIRKMTTRWGVCNRGNNTITLNSELIKKDIALIDYVVIHELCHFIEANHSQAFWSQVAKRYPNYKEARKKLRG